MWNTNFMDIGCDANFVVVSIVDGSIDIEINLKFEMKSVNSKFL